MAECPVCLDSIKNACRAPCQHVFCRPCILEAMKAKPPEWSGACPLCRAHTSVYNLRDASGSLLAEPEMKTPYGCIFVQGGTLGLASYHFDSPDNCYLSYAHAPSAWRLADGSAPPEKKPWTECTYNAETLTFNGVVEWNPAFGGMDRWDYEIVFTEDFAAVVGGKVVMRKLDGSTMSQPFQVPWAAAFDRSLAYLRWTPPPTTIFGCAYVQGHLYAPILEGLASYHFDSEADCYISYSNVPPDWLLDDGTAPPQKKPFCNPLFNADTRTFKGHIEWAPTFQGDARWDYDMVFAEDFGSIVSGEICAFGPDGAPRPGTSFRNPADLFVLGSDGMCYVQRPGVLNSQAKVLERINLLPDQETAE